MQVKDIVRRTLTRIVREQIDEDEVCQWLLQPFIKKPDESEDQSKARMIEEGNQLREKIKEILAGQKLVNVDEGKIVMNQFSIIPQDQIENLAEYTKKISKFNIAQQTEQESEWFDACMSNKMETIRRVAYLYYGSQEKRATDYLDLHQTSFSGLMYACAYNNREAFNYLLDQEVSVLTQNPTLFQFKG